MLGNVEVPVKEKESTYSLY